MPARCDAIARYLRGEARGCRHSRWSWLEQKRAQRRQRGAKGTSARHPTLFQVGSVDHTGSGAPKCGLPCSSPAFSPWRCLARRPRAASSRLRRHLGCGRCLAERRSRVIRRVGTMALTQEVVGRKMRVPLSKRGLLAPQPASGGGKGLWVHVRRVPGPARGYYRRGVGRHRRRRADPDLFPRCRLKRRRHPWWACGGWRTRRTTRNASTAH